MIIWEYDQAICPAVDLSYIRSQGRRGWELVTILPGCHGEFRLFFKRPKRKAASQPRD